MKKVKERFEFLKNLSGTIYREQPGRLTKAILLDQKNTFVKLHFGVGWKEIFKSLFQLRFPILGAKTELHALQKLALLGVPTLTPIEFGEFGWNPAHRHSFLVTEALNNVMSLESLCASWSTIKPTVAFKRAIIRAVAEIARTIHQHGVNHRDFYLCHFLLDEVLYAQQGKVCLYLIDLHRAQLRKKTPWRWQLKDIAGLYFSALNVPLTSHDLFCFMQAYASAIPSGKVNIFWKEVEQKAKVLHQKKSETLLFLDARALPCPWPIAEAKLVLKKMFQGERLIVWCKDEMSVLDFKAFCFRMKYTLEEVIRHIDFFELKIRV